MAGDGSVSSWAAAVGVDQRTALWVMSREGRRVEAEVCRDGDHRWELRLSADGVTFASRRFSLLASAVAYADMLRADFEHDRWA